MHDDKMTFFEKIDQVLRPVGLTLGSLIVGFLGAWSSLEFFPGISRKRKVALVISGGLTAAFGGQIISHYLHVSHLIYALTFFAGLLGMKITNWLIFFGQAFFKHPKLMASIIGMAIKSIFKK